MKLTVWGVGYVGLVSGACLADSGHDVLCVDIDANKISSLQNGGIPIHEPGLKQIVARACASGRLRFTCDAEKGVSHAELQMIAVGTPPDASGAPNLSYLMSVARTIGRYMSADRIIVNKSTVPVGTADRATEAARVELAARGLALHVEAVSNPEFLKEGAAISDFVAPDRVIAGVSSARAGEQIRELYAPFLKTDSDLIVMDPKSAEFTKYAANAMLATRVSFMNEMSNLAEHLGVDIEPVKNGIGRDKRIGAHFLNPGCGYGGSCFPKDIQGIQHMADKSNCALPLINAVAEVNRKQRHILFEKIAHHFGGAMLLAGKTIAVWGLSFKANTDDLRNSPAIDLVKSLLACGVIVQAHDPVCGPAARALFEGQNGFSVVESTLSSLDGASALAICTDWSDYQKVSLATIVREMKLPVIVDGRNMFDPDDCELSGITYYGIGRGISRFTGPKYGEAVSRRQVGAAELGRVMNGSAP